jgi:hypothetical protein
MERRVGNTDKPLRFERLNMKTSRNEEGEFLEEKALFSQVGHKSFQCKNC